MDADEEERKARRDALLAELAAESQARNNDLALDGIITFYDNPTRADREQRWLHERLSRRGYSVWVERDVRPGQHADLGYSIVYCVMTDLRCPLDERTALIREIDDEMKAEVASKQAARDRERAVAEAERAKIERRTQKIERVKDRIAVAVFWVVAFFAVGFAWIIFEEVFLRR